MRILACPFLRPVLSNKNCSRPLKFITETLLKEVTSKSISFYKELCSPSAICTYKGGKIRSRYTRILILILKIWEFPRLRVGFSKKFENFWGWGLVFQSSLRTFEAEVLNKGSRILKRILENSQNLRWEWGQEFWGFPRILVYWDLILPP